MSEKYADKGERHNWPAFQRELSGGSYSEGLKSVASFFHAWASKQRSAPQRNSHQPAPTSA